jgi:hypothetical protein
LILWKLRATIDETASKRDQVIAHNLIGSRIGRSGQACRIQLCSMKKNVKLLSLAYALEAPSSPQTEEAPKKAEAQPEKKPSEKARVQPKKRPSAKARARAIKKPSVKVEAQPQKPLPTFSPSTAVFTPSPVASTPSRVAFTPRPVALMPSPFAFAPSSVASTPSSGYSTPSPAASTPSLAAFTPSSVTLSPVSVQQGSDAAGSIPQWRGHTGYRDVPAADSTSEAPFPREEVM